MNHFRVHNIKGLDETSLQKGMYLILLNVTQKPPHILLCINGNVFSVTPEGPKLYDKIEPYLTLIKRKGIPTLFAELVVPGIFTFDLLQKKMVKSAEKFGSLSQDGVTCLTSIKSFCASVYDEELVSTQFVYDLLPALSEKGFIKDYFSMNLQSLLSNGAFEMRKYTMEDVKDSILAV